MINVKTSEVIDFFLPKFLIFVFSLILWDFVRFFSGLKSLRSSEVLDFLLQLPWFRAILTTATHFSLTLLTEICIYYKWFKILRKKS